MKITIKLNKKDLYLFSIHNLLHRISLYISSIILALAIFFIRNKDLSQIKLINSIIEFIPYLLISYLILFSISILLVSTSKNKKFLEEKTYELDEKSITIYWNEAKFPIRWKEFKKIDENKNFFYFYISSNQALIFPKRDLDKIMLKEMYKIIKKINKQIKK